MIQIQLQLKVTRLQENELKRWLWHLTGVYNWAVRKIELSAKDKIYYTELGFKGLLSSHSKKLKIHSHVLQATLGQAWLAWNRCFKKLAKSPRLKSRRNRLTSIPFQDPFGTPVNGRIYVHGIGKMRFHKMPIPEGKIKSGRIVQRASGWYLCLFIASDVKAVKHKADRVVGIDPGYETLLTLSDGEKISHPKELKEFEIQLGRVQRGGGKKKTARLQEHIKNTRKDRNHKLTHRLTAECEKIYWSKDKIKGLQKTFGKGVLSAGHGEIRSMLAYKMPASGRLFIEVPSKNSTRTCSACRILSGPTGWAGLSIREWTCTACGSHWDRDVNSALNTLFSGTDGASMEVMQNAA